VIEEPTRVEGTYSPRRRFIARIRRDGLSKIATEGGKTESDYSQVTYIQEKI